MAEWGLYKPHSDGLVVKDLVSEGGRACVQVLAIDFSTYVTLGKFLTSPELVSSYVKFGGTGESPSLEGTQLKRLLWE